MTIGIIAVVIAVILGAIVACICASYMDNDSEGSWFLAFLLVAACFSSAYFAGYREGQYNTLEAVKAHGLGQVVLVDEKRVFKFNGEE